MDFTTSSDFVTPQEFTTTPLASLQLHEFDHFNKLTNSNYDINMDDENNSNLSNNVASDLKFWENNYTSQHIPALLGHGQTSSQSNSISPTLQNELIDDCIKKEIENDNDLNGNISPESIHHQQQDISEEELYLKRKLQNRALQRLFRERKESKLKELSSMLSKTELEKEKLVKELEQLRKQNTMLTTENQVLMKNGSNPDINTAVQSTGQFSFPKDKKVFINGFVSGSGHDVDKLLTFDNLVYEYEGKNMLTIGAVWDYLHEFNMENEDKEVDVMKVMNLIKGNERCHGYGPGYPMKIVKDLVEKVLKDL